MQDRNLDFTEQIYHYLAVLHLGHGARFSKAPKSFRDRKDIRKTLIR